MDSRFGRRTAIVGGAIGLALAFSLALMWGGRSSQANVIPGEYSMEATIALTSSPADGATTFPVRAALVHGFGTPVCPAGGDPLPYPDGCYQGVQWELDYDEALVDITAINQVTRVAGAPGECTSRQDNGSRLLLGCLVLPGGTLLNYSGDIWNANFFCKTDVSGLANFTLTLGDQPTFVSDGVNSLPIHLHHDSIFCGNPPPTATATATNTPLPPTFTATATPTNTATPTRTPTATATIAVPPDQDQFHQFAFNPDSFGSSAAMLAAIDLAMEVEINFGWDVVDSASADVSGDPHVLYALQRNERGPKRADLTNDGVIDLLDALAVVNAFGLQVTANSFRHIVFDPSSYVDGAALLAAIEGQAETEIAAGWDVADTTVLTIDGSPQIVLSLQERNITPGPDINGTNGVDLLDALIVLQLFSTPLPPGSTLPIPQGPNRFKHLVINPASYPNAASQLFLTDFDIEKEIAAAFDPVDSALLTLDGSPRLVYSLERSLRPHRADRNGDNVIDLLDALAVLADFGQPGINAFNHLSLDPTGQPDAQSLINAIDPVMEAQISLGYDVMHSTEITLDGNERLLFGLQLETIPSSSDLDGNGVIDLLDALITLQLFGQTP